MHSNRDQLLFSGIPATGKSFFCRWSEREHKYVHWDFDVMLADRAKHQQALQPLMDILSASTPAQAQGFVNQLPPRIAIDWGFPPETIQAVERLKSAGFRLFWFDGDRARARLEFIARNTVPVQELDIQMPKIDAAWAQIYALFAPNHIDVLSADGRRMSENEIWKIVGSRVA